MTLVPSLLQAIVLTDGEALVLHVGDTPYVVTEKGQVSLANAPLTSESIAGVLDELLPTEARRALEAVGATKCLLPQHALFPGERFSVVAARAEDDLWLEIRRSPQQTRSWNENEGATVVGPSPAPAPRSADRRGVGATAPSAQRTRPESAPAAVLLQHPAGLRPEPPAGLMESALSGLDRLLRLAVARGSSTLYLQSGAVPSIRTDGEARALEGISALSASEVEALLLTLFPGHCGTETSNGVASEWISEFAELGQVRCVRFRDRGGPGAVFRIMPRRAATTEELGLPRQVEALTDCSDGLLVVTGPRQSGKRMLLSALVDRINRNRRVHIITIEQEIKVVHEPLSAVVSQREVPDPEQMAAAIMSALREDPDVLVLDDMRTPDVAELALTAAARGCLVIGGFLARGASDAAAGLIDLLPASERDRLRLVLARHLRGVVAQVLVLKRSGGQVAAREVLLNTPVVRALLAEGHTVQLPLAIEGGREQGMVPLNDVLAGLVQSGTVEVREASRCAADRAGLLGLLQRQGMDVSAAERLS